MMKDFDLLGRAVVDVVTGFKGIVSTIGYDLYGCVQAIVTPLVDKDGKPDDGKWFDTKRLKVTDVNPVMAVPSFESVAGGTQKPAQPTNPIR